MLLPLLGWGLTGVVFLTKPGYAGAYEQLGPKLYPLDRGMQIAPTGQWTDVRLVKTILGDHLLVKVDDDYRHLDPLSLTPIEPPSTDNLKRLVADAVADKNARYGQITKVVDNVVYTSTGIEISVDWNRLALRQRGRDTDLINLLYKIHYLQWTPSAVANTALGVLGILFLLVLTVLGLNLYLQGRAARAVKRADLG